MKPLTREQAQIDATRLENWVRFKSWPYSNVSPRELLDEIGKANKTEYSGLDGYRRAIADLRAI